MNVASPRHLQIDKRHALRREKIAVPKIVLAKANIVAIEQRFDVRANLVEEDQVGRGY